MIRGVLEKCGESAVGARALAITIKTTATSHSESDVGAHALAITIKTTGPQVDSCGMGCSVTQGRHPPLNGFVMFSPLHG